MNGLAKVVIIGGGISGLAAAYRLSELGRERGLPLHIILVEAKSRLGGVIESRQQDGFLLEGGPDSFISEKPAALQLSKRLGISEEVLGTNPEFRRAFIYKNEKLIRVPEGFYLIAPSQIKAFLATPLLSWMTKLRMGYELLIPPRRTQGDESVASFVRRRFGETALREIAQPMLSGIYTADPERLSLEATMPQFLELELKYGSVIKGLLARKKMRSQSTESAGGPRYSLFLSFKKGMQELPDSLEQNLPGVEIKLNASVTRVERGEKWHIDFQSGAPLEADAVCLALPGHQASQLLSHSARWFSGVLARVPYESVATVNLAYKRRDIPHPLNGFGFVVPAAAKRKMVACSFSSVKFQGRAPDGTVLLRAFVGGALHRDVYALDDATMKIAVTDELRHFLGVQKPPLFSFVHRYPKAMPQYQVGHLNLVRSIQAHLKDFPGLFLAGNAYRGIGVPDCIQWAEQTAEAMLAFLKTSRSPVAADAAKSSSNLKADTQDGI